MRLRPVVHDGRGRRTLIPAGAVAASGRSRRADSDRNCHGPRSCRTRQPAPSRQQALQQARVDPQRLPEARRPPQRGRPLRPDPPGRPAHQPRDGLPRAPVDGGGRHRAQGGLRRGPVPLRALLPAPAPLPPHLPDLQPLVRVPQLGHRGADRGDRRRPELLGPAERAADLRHLRGVPDRAGRSRPTAVTTELLFARDAMRIAIATERSGFEFYSQAARAAHDPRGQTVFQRARRARSGSTSRRSSAATSTCWRATRGSSRARRSCSSRAPPTASSRRGPSRWRGAWTTAGPDGRHQVRAGVAPLLQALRRAVRGLRRQAGVPRVRRARSARTSSCSFASTVR